MGNKNRQQQPAQQPQQNAAPATTAISSEEGKQLAAAEQGTSAPAETPAVDQNLSAEQQQTGNEPPAGEEADLAAAEQRGEADREALAQESAPETLLGSSVQPARVLVGGEEVELGYAVSQAHQASGLTVAEWNAQPEADREAAIAAAIDAPVEPEAPTAAPAAKSVDVAAAVPQAVKPLVEGASVLGQAQLQTFVSYIEGMDPRKPITEAEGARFQVQLFRVLTNVINRLEDDFEPVFTVILRLFDEHREGVFAETSVFRFIPQVSLAEPDRRTFLALLNLMKVAAPVKGRAIALKQVDFTRTLAGKAISEPGRQRVLGYFGV